MRYFPYLTLCAESALSGALYTTSDPIGTPPNIFFQHFYGQIMGKIYDCNTATASSILFSATSVLYSASATLISHSVAISVFSFISSRTRLV